MIELLTDSRALAAIAIVLVIPVLIIGIGELEEQLRQRDSALTGIVSMIRNWTIPLFTTWAILLWLFSLSRTNPLVRLVATAMVLSLAAEILAVLRLLITWWRTRPLDDGARRRIPQLLLALPRVLLLVVTGWVLLDTVWGLDLSSALTALGVTSLVVSFALQDTLSGLASGFLLLSDAPFQPGDWIRVGDIEGRVVDINWRSSRIENRNGDLLIVPNAQLAAGTVVNYAQPSELHRVVVPVQVAYTNPPTLAKEMLIDAARSTPGVLQDPPPSARVVQIDDPLMGYEVDMWITDFRDAPRVSSQFGSLVWYQSHRHDVPLPSPAYDLYVYDGEHAAEAGRPKRAEIRRRLRASALLDQLDEDDIERLASAARPVRYSTGEAILAAGAQSRDLHVLWQGQARITVATPQGDLHEVARLAEGDVFGLLGPSPQWQGLLQVVAVTDCEVVVVDEAAAGEVASRNPALSAALNRLVSMRGRRIARILEQAREEASEEIDEASTSTDATGGP